MASNLLLADAKCVGRTRDEWMNKMYRGAAPSGRHVPTGGADLRRSRRPWLSLGVAALVAGCGGGWDGVGGGSEPPAQHFGFTAVDCGHDDPLDNAATTNYLSEVAAFSSTAHMCVHSPDEQISSRLALMDGQDVGAFLSIQALLYESRPDTTSPSGQRLSLRADYQARWRRFVELNDLRHQVRAITAFYLADEPVWNGMSEADLRAGADFIKADFPLVPLAFIEAAPALQALRIPPSVDWIGFDHYAVASPDTDAVYLRELAQLKSLRSRPSQKLLLVMDAQWLPMYGEAGYQPADMKRVAASYARLAQRERADVAGMLGYVWPGGLDHPAQQGARELPASVIEEYVRIGRSMTGRP